MDWKKAQQAAAGKAMFPSAGKGSNALFVSRASRAKSAANLSELPNNFIFFSMNTINFIFH